MIKLYLLLGGNLGNKQQVFADARTRLEKQVGIISAQSAIYETEPWGFESEDLFWNQALELKTDLSPEDILEQTQLIEKELGRIRKEKQYDSRVIDIDIMFFGDQVIKTGNLTVPHPRIQERKFALVPLCEIAGDFIHPVFRKGIGELLNECTDQLKVSRVDNS